MFDDWNVLVIDDEPDSADVVARILSFHQIKHKVASTAEEALSAMAEEMPTGLIVDLALPGMDGWGLISEVRNNPETANLPVIAVTAFHSVSIAEQAVRSGFTAYLPKPIEVSTLVSELEHVFEHTS